MASTWIFTHMHTLIRPLNEVVFGDYDNGCLILSSTVSCYCYLKIFVLENLVTLPFYYVTFECWKTHCNTCFQEFLKMSSIKFYHIVNLVFNVQHITMTNILKHMYYTSLILHELWNARKPWQTFSAVGLCVLKTHIIKRILRPLLLWCKTQRLT